MDRFTKAAMAAAVRHGACCTLLAWGSTAPAWGAVCTSPSGPVQALTANDPASFCNAFWAAATIDDRFLFSMDATSILNGSLVTQDWSWTTAIELAQVSVTDLLSGHQWTDTSPSDFAFQLQAGTYRLDIQGLVSGHTVSFPGTVGYQADLRLDPFAVPEPTTMALLASGASLLALRRRGRPRRPTTA